MNEEKRDSAHLLSLPFPLPHLMENGHKQLHFLFTVEKRKSVKQMTISIIGIQVNEIVKDLHTGTIEGLKCNTSKYFASTSVHI